MKERDGVGLGRMGERVWRRKQDSLSSVNTVPFGIPKKKKKRKASQKRKLYPAKISFSFFFVVSFSFVSVLQSVWLDVNSSKGCLPPPFWTENKGEKTKLSFFKKKKERKKEEAIRSKVISPPSLFPSLPLPCYIGFPLFLIDKLSCVGSLSNLGCDHSESFIFPSLFLFFSFLSLNTVNWVVCFLKSSYFAADIYSFHISCCVGD